jgi:hypothetical protein
LSPIAVCAELKLMTANAASGTTDIATKKAMSRPLRL